MRLRIAIYLLLALAYLIFFIEETGAPAVVVKALPVSWLVIWALQQARSQPQLAIALAFGACGDVFMALDLFIAGLTAFLAGHIAYIALWLSAPKHGRWITLAPIALLMLVACWFILPAADGMQIPVAGYFLIIAVMAALATRTQCLDLWGLLGVYLFLLSDFIIGWNRFVEPLGWSAPAIMLTYYAAQGLIANSVITAHARVKLRG